MVRLHCHNLQQLLRMCYPTNERRDRFLIDWTSMKQLPKEEELKSFKQLFDTLSELV